MKEARLEHQLREAQETIDLLQAKLQETMGELLKTNSDLLQLTMELDDRVEQRTEELKRKDEEIRAISQQLCQAEKLATMGELASSIAHELNNPLATVSLRSESLLAKFPDDSPYRREVEIIEQEVERMANLVANLLQFSRRSQQQMSLIDICEEIDKTLELIVYHFHRHRINVVRDFGQDIPGIYADRQQLRQLFLNLFTNASDAMPQGGTLTILVREIRGLNRIGIEIADTGIGIPSDIISKVAEPFYTTKSEGKGTGLGLCICRRIVQGHNGKFEIISNGIPGQGTCVTIELPGESAGVIHYRECTRA